LVYTGGMDTRESETAEFRCGRCKRVLPAAEFPPSARKNGGYCRPCRRKPAPDPINCEQCGTEISRPVSRQRFCSPACKQAALRTREPERLSAYRRARYREAHPPQPSVPEGFRRCGRCKTVKPEAEFYRRKTDGKINSWCIQCYHDRHLARHTPKSGATNEPRPCIQCGKTYSPQTRRPSVYCSRECKEQARVESGRYREGHLRRRYGITQADYDAKLAEQGGGCALCGVRPEELAKGRYRTWLHVDHDHVTGRVRGLLCPDHNLLLGRWGDDPALLRRAADYIEGARVGRDAAGGAVPG
jgi:Recombination endonuclease VII